MNIVKYNSSLLGEISYDTDQYALDKDGYLRYIGTSTKPTQPIGLHDYSCMFANRGDLEILDLSEWDLSKFENNVCMFFNCTGLKKLICSLELSVDDFTKYIKEGKKDV